MNTELEETTETIEYTSDVLTSDGETVTPTRSPVKAGFFDRPHSRILMYGIPIVCFVGGIILVFMMGISAQTHEITSTTYNQAGACLNVKSFMIHTYESGENPALFDKYQAAHPDEKPIESTINHGCPIPLESNTRH